MKPVRVYMGWDARDALAYDVCRSSLLRHASVPVEIIPLKDWELRHRGVFWRSYRTDAAGQRWDDRDGKPFSSDFSFGRFVVPMLEEYGDEWVLFMDPDMLVREDIAKLFELSAPSLDAVMCVQHKHEPPEREKMAGLNKQTLYRRKNWSSLMLMKPSRCGELTKYAVNNQSGQWLHAMNWTSDSEIGSLPEEWNWLEGWSSPDIDPKIVHFTRGTPDFEGTEDVPYADEWRGYVRWQHNQELFIPKSQLVEPPLAAVGA